MLHESLDALKVYMTLMTAPNDAPDALPLLLSANESAAPISPALPDNDDENAVNELTLALAATGCLDIVGPPVNPLIAVATKRGVKNVIPSFVLDYLRGVPQDVLTIGFSSSAAAAAYKLLKTWIDARNGRKLKIKVGDIEVEATQMPEADVLRIFELLQEKADRKKIRELLISASKGEGRPEGH